LLELSAPRHDLGLFAGHVDSVKTLRLAGSAENGRIDTVTGLGALPGLESLEIQVPVKRGLEAAELPHLKSCALSWQAGCEVLTGIPSLRALVLRGFGAPSLKALQVPKGLTDLWLDRPALLSLEGVASMPALRVLRISNAKALASLQGLGGGELDAIDIEKAPLLQDITALSRAPSVRQVRLVGTSTAIDLRPLAGLTALRRLHAGGPGMPALDWMALLKLPALEFVSGGWDPGQASEADLRSQVPPGRHVTRFSPVPKRGVQPLIVEIGA
jgi:hypothetical protein